MFEKCQIEVVRSEKEDFFLLYASKYISRFKKRKTVILTAFPESFAVLLLRLFSNCVQIIDLPSDFLKGSWASQRQHILPIEGKKMCNEMFIFLLFVQFVLINSEEIVSG